MKHLGDITKIKGNEIPIVDVVTGGSPCQDLSVAGKRAGLDGERSGLFMEQIRVIKEMREYDRETNQHSGMDIKPRYMVWENVPGAFSSNGGEDFRCVLEETARIAEEGVSIPGLAKGEKWSYAGVIYGDGWSIAWRTHDLQYWGCPQRRKRISVLADFNGWSAGELLFECFRETDTNGVYEIVGRTGIKTRFEVHTVGEGLRRDLAESGRQGKEVAGTVGEGVKSASYTLKISGAVEVDSYGKKARKGALVQTELSGTLGVSQDQTLFDNKNVISVSHGGFMVNADDSGIAHTLEATDYKDPKTVAYYGFGRSDKWDESEVGCTQSAHQAKCYTDLVVMNKAYCIGNGQVDQLKLNDKVGALNCMHDQQAVVTVLHGEDSPRAYDIYNFSETGEVGRTISAAGGGLNEHIPAVVERAVPSYGLDRASFNQGQNAKFDFSVEKEISPTIVARGPGGVLTEQ